MDFNNQDSIYSVMIYEGISKFEDNLKSVHKVHQIKGGIAISSYFQPHGNFVFNANGTV